MLCVTCEKVEREWSLYECKDCAAITRRKVILQLITPKESLGHTDGPNIPGFGKTWDRMNEDQKAAWYACVPAYGEL